MPPLQIKQPDDQLNLGVTTPSSLPRLSIAPTQSAQPLQVSTQQQQPMRLAQQSGQAAGPSPIAGSQDTNTNPIMSPADKFKNDIMNAGKGLLQGLTSAPEYFYRTDIYNPLRETAAQFTGNQQAYQNAEQSVRNTMGTNPKQALTRLAGNTIQLGSLLAAPAAGMAEKTLAAQIAKGAVVGGGLNAAGTAGYQLAQNGKLNPKGIAEGAGLGVLLGGGAPIAGRAINIARENAVPLNEAGGVGKSVGGQNMNSNADMSSGVKAQAKEGPSISPEVQQYARTFSIPIEKAQSDLSRIKANETPVHLQRQGQGITPDMITDRDRAEASYTMSTPEEVVGSRMASIRSADGERAAIETLSKGGTRDEAIAVYRQMTNESQKMAAYRVQVAAKQAEQALHPNAEGVNPVGRIDISPPREGDYMGVVRNKNKVTGYVDSANRDVQSFRGLLTENDKNNFRHYVEGTKNIAEADNPQVVDAAVRASKNLTDTVHAMDPLAPRYIKDFFPNYWNLEDPEVQARLQLKAEQDIEEKLGPETWGAMSNEERQKEIAQYTREAIDGDTNYNPNMERGFHAQARIFANSAEGEAANMVHVHDDPFDDLQRYATGAKIDMEGKIVKRSIDAADGPRQLEKGARNTIDLGGGKSVRVSDRAYKALRGLDIKDARGPIAKAWQGLTSVVTQAIVLNPTIHGANLAVQGFIEAGRQPLFNADGLLGRIPSGPIGGVRFIGNTVRMLANRQAFRAASAQYLKDGGHIPTYGRNARTVLTQAADAAHLPHFSKANAAAMSKIDGLFRVARHDENLRMGVNPDTSVKSIDAFMGDQRAIPEVARNIGLFYHWFRTEVTATVRTFTNVGSLVNAGIALAAWYGLNKAWQDWTGNKNAHIRAPGELGLAKEVYDIGEKRNVQSITTPITNHINPLITAIANQAFGKDQFTGQQLKTPKQRASDLLSTTVAPTQGIQRVMAGKRSAAENALNIFGVYTPHAKDAPAIPNANNPLAKIVNTPGAKPVKFGNDPTGYSQEINWYNQKAKVLNSFNPDTDQKTIDQFNTYLDKNHTNAGQTILNNGPQSESNARMLASNDRLRQAIQQLEKSQPNHDPKWDLSDAQLKTYMQYESITPGEKARTVMEQKNSWIVDAFKAEQTWFNQQQLNGNVTYPPDYVKYPTLTPDQQTMMTQVTSLSKIDNRTPDQQNQLNQLEQNPDLQAAYGLLLSYTNARRSQDGLQPIAADAQLTPQEEQALTYESSLPSKTGAKSAFIKANQDLWNSIQNKLSAITMQSIASNGAIVYEGGTPSNSYLKDIYNAGKYDIAKGTNPAGQSTFVVNPTLAYSGGTQNGFTFGGSSGTSRTGSSGSKSTKRPLVPAPKRVKVKKTKLKRPSSSKRAGKSRLVKLRKANQISAQGFQPTRVLNQTKVLNIQH